MITFFVDAMILHSNRYTPGIGQNKVTSSCENSGHYHHIVPNAVLMKQKKRLQLATKTLMPSQMPK